MRKDKIMRKSSRLGAVLLAVAVIASACGGSSEVESDQAALLEELEAQVEKLTAEAEAAEQAAAEPIPEPRRLRPNRLWNKRLRWRKS